MSTTERLIEGFLAEGWKSNPFKLLFQILNEERRDALALALNILERIPKSTTFFHALLSHLSEDEFRNLIAAAVGKLESGQYQPAEDVFAYGSLQFPELLTPYLRELFRLRPNSDTYYEKWPWRAADEQEIVALQADVDDPDSDDEVRARAWRCLLESRRADLFAYLGARFDSLPLSYGEFDDYLQMLGFICSDGTPRRLYSEPVYHITFPEDYFVESDIASFKAHTNHPTWASNVSDTLAADFGGEISNRCGVCAGQLHRLIRIENASAVLPVTLPHVDLCTCLSCLGWEAHPLFFTHDEAGSPTTFTTEAPTRTPEFPSAPLKPAKVTLAKTPSRWRFQDWALANGRENLHRIGGAPTWIQDSEYPSCPTCGRIMQFIAQLDSNLPTADSGEILWGSSGICYMFWCDPCRISGNFWQCT